jgi:peptidyl-prolyl cis-trans isomerase C
MKVSYRVIVLVVCAFVGTVFAVGKPKKEAKMKARPPAVEAKVDTNAPAPAEKEKPVTKEEAGGAAVQPTIQQQPAEKVAAPVTSAAPPAPAAVLRQQGAGETIDGNEPAVTVNGSVITEGEIGARLSPMLRRHLSRMDPNMAAQYKRRLREQMVNALIEERLLDERVKKAGISVSESDVNDRIDRMAFQQGISINSLKILVESQGQSYEQFQQQIKKAVGYEKLVELEGGVAEINEANALAYYNENKEMFSKPEQVKASHILIKVAPSATPEEKAAAREKAEKLLKEIKEGADFAELAKANSDCVSKTEGGNLGFFERGKMVKEFEDAAFAMQPGEISDIVETQFGYHIIKVTNRVAAHVISFEEIKSELINGLKQMEVNKVYKPYVDKLKAGARIEYPPGKEPIAARREILQPAEVPPAPK